MGMLMTWTSEGQPGLPGVPRPALPKCLGQMSLGDTEPRREGPRVVRPPELGLVTPGAGPCSERARTLGDPPWPRDRDSLTLSGGSTGSGRCRPLPAAV